MYSPLKYVDYFFRKKDATGYHKLFCGFHNSVPGKWMQSCLGKETLQ